ncbi:hypothetical protein ABPG74_015209 [Tetrahymena malaccensis]
MTDEKFLMIKISNVNQNYQDFINYILLVFQLLSEQSNLNLLNLEKIYQAKKFCYIACHKYECNLLEAFLNKKFQSIYNVVQLLLKIVEAYLNTFGEYAFLKSHNCLNYENILLINSLESDQIKICFRDAWASPELIQAYRQIVSQHNSQINSQNQSQKPMLPYYIAPEIQQQPQIIGSNAADMYSLGYFLYELRQYNEALRNDTQLVQLFIQMCNQNPNERITWPQLQQQLLAIQARMQTQPNNQISSQFFQNNNVSQQINTLNTMIVGNQMNNQLVSTQQATSNPQQNFLQNNQKNFQSFQNQQFIQYQNYPNYNNPAQQISIPQQNISQAYPQNQPIQGQLNQMNYQQNYMPFNSQNNYQDQFKQQQMQTLNQQGPVNQIQKQSQLIGQQIITNQYQFQQQQQQAQNSQQQISSQNNVIQYQRQNQNNMAQQQQQQQQQNQQVPNTQTLLTWQAQQNEFLNIQSLTDQIKQNIQGYDHLADSLIEGEEAIQIRNLSMAFKELFYEFTKDDIYLKYNLENEKVIEFLVCVLQYSFLAIKKSKEIANKRSIELNVLKIFDQISKDFKETEYIKKKYIDDLKKDFPEQLFDNDPDYKLLFNTNTSDGSKLFEETLKTRLQVNLKQMEVELISLKVKQKYKNNNHISGLCYRIEKLKDFNSLVWNKQKNTTFNFKLYYEKLSQFEQSNL